MILKWIVMKIKLYPHQIEDYYELILYTFELLKNYF
jgi:hypothetical protein